MLAEPTYRLDKNALSAARLLPDAPDLYFVRDAGCLMLAVDDLVVTRARPEGIAGAVRKMAEASRGERERRAPVTVSRRSDGRYDVCDGNSTVIVARAAGWKAVPALDGLPPSKA